MPVLIAILSVIKYNFVSYINKILYCAFCKYWNIKY